MRPVSLRRNPIVLSVVAIVALFAGIAVGMSMAPILNASEQRQAITITVTTTVTGTGEAGQGTLAGEIEIDGSSTVYPLTEAAAEEFMRLHPQVKITIGISGTGGGFKRFVIGETDVNDASRPILRSEAETAAKNGIEWIEVPVGLEGLAIVVHPSNTWVDCMTISELREIWKPDSTITRWSQIRSGWPDRPIKLYGAGPDSGTFDYFTERVVGKLKSQRTDYVASEDDNVLVEGVAAEPYALGYIPFAYVAAAGGKVKAVPVKDDAVEGSACIEPTDDTVRSFKYPLSRPLFIYVNKDSWNKKPALREFVIFYLQNGVRLNHQVHYTPLLEDYYRVAAVLLRAGITDGLYALTGIMLRNAGPH